MGNNCVSINLKKDQIVIKIAEDAEQKRIISELSRKISDLKKLEIKGYTLTPLFSADVYEYKLELKDDITSLDVLAEGANDKVDIEIVGNTDLKERRKYYNNNGQKHGNK